MERPPRARPSAFCFVGLQVGISRWKRKSGCAARCCLSVWWGGRPSSRCHATGSYGAARDSGRYRQLPAFVNWRCGNRPWFGRTLCDCWRGAWSCDGDQNRGGLAARRPARPLRRVVAGGASSVTIPTCTAPLPAEHPASPPSLAPHRCRRSAQRARPPLRRTAAGRASSEPLLPAARPG